MEVKLKKTLTVANILNQNIQRVPFSGQFYDAFRQPQNRGVWLIWGGSSSGKSYFVMQLAKEFAKHMKTFYNLLEEETDDSDFIERTESVGMLDVEGNYSAGSYEYEELCTHLDKRGSPKVVIIDSATYFFKNFDQYKEFKKKYRKKIIVITAHAKGNNPRHELETSIMFDAKQKIFVTGFLASCKGRTIGPNGGIYITWQEGYERLRGSQENEND